MMIVPLARVPMIMHVVAVLWALIAIVLVLVILIQKGKGGGLGAAFGGAAAQSLLGTKTGDFFTWFTIMLVVLFLGLGVVMAKFYRPSGQSELAAPAVEQQPMSGQQSPGGETTGTEASEQSEPDQMQTEDVEQWMDSEQDSGAGADTQQDQ